MDQFLEMHTEDLLSEQKEAPACLTAVKTLIVPILQKSGKKPVTMRGFAICQMKWSRDRMSERRRGLDHVRDLVHCSPYEHCTGTTEGSTMKCWIKTKQLVVRIAAVGSLCLFPLSQFSTLQNESSWNSRPPKDSESSPAH